MSNDVEPEIAWTAGDREVLLLDFGGQYVPLSQHGVFCSHVRALVVQVQRDGVLPQLRADCVELVPIMNGRWEKGCEATPGATHEVWSVPDPDYEGEDGWHHGDIRIERIAELEAELESLRGFKRSVDEALNSGDGAYRP